MSAENGELIIGISHRADASVSQPGNNAQPEIVRPAEAGSSNSQPGEALAKTLSDINVNMGTMASLLQTIVARQDSKPQKKRRNSPHDLSSADSESEDNDYEASGKRRGEEDELSISPSDEDINEFLEESNPKEAEVTAKTTEAKEVELLKSLEADFTDDELIGAKTNQRLANIASKRRGITLTNDKLKALLAKHTKPENCPDITTVRVNPEIWDQMNNFRRKADLRVSNIQQALQKATFGILKVCDKLVDQQPSTD